jgi:superfamily II DNA/RNA helicase
MMFRFKSGQIDVLVATDILSRGIDIDDISMVINYDVPHDSEDYVHRIGRTARADRDGRAVTFVSQEDIYYFMQIEDFLERIIPKTPLPEGLGETPEYIPNKKTGSKKRGYYGKARGRGGKGKGHSSGNNAGKQTRKPGKRPNPNKKHGEKKE